MSHNGNFLKEPVLSDILSDICFHQEMPRLVHRLSKFARWEQKPPRKQPRLTQSPALALEVQPTSNHEDQDTAMTHQGMKTAMKKTRDDEGRRSEGVWVFDTGEAACPVENL